MREGKLFDKSLEPIIGFAIMVDLLPS